LGDQTSPTGRRKLNKPPHLTIDSLRLRLLKT